MFGTQRTKNYTRWSSYEFPRPLWEPEQSPFLYPSRIALVTDMGRAARQNKLEPQWLQVQAVALRETTIVVKALVNGW